jgi:hypothetical protein
MNLIVNSQEEANPQLRYLPTVIAFPGTMNHA